MTVLREGLPQLPERMRSLPIDTRGYPVPWFVAWVNGEPDFRIADGQKLYRALRQGCCWVCGEPVGKFKTCVIGPMCAVNRTTAEPPCHLECAIFAATACPFLRLPRAQRRDANIPDGLQDPAGMKILRNPGVTLLWTTTSCRRWDVDDGVLFRLGSPSEVRWYCQGRTATRAEVLESIDSGMPSLRELADKEGSGVQLQQQYNDMLRLLPV
jgi:hypothetical protein